MMRFLEYDFLKDHRLSNFDNWVTVFGEQKTEWELAPAGNKFKERTRIANYTGLPELMSMFKQVADVRTPDWYRRHRIHQILLPVQSVPDPKYRLLFLPLLRQG